MKKAHVFLVLNLWAAVTALAQVAINDSGTAPDNSSMLDVKAVNKGLLIPRVGLISLTDVFTIPNPSVSLLIYNTTTSAELIPGYYYWNGIRWKMLLSGSANGGDGDWTIAWPNLYSAPPGNVGIGVVNPVSRLDIDAASLTGIKVTNPDIGLVVTNANNGIAINNPILTGMNITSAGSHGILIGTSFGDGVHVTKAGDNGVLIDSSGNDGLRIIGGGKRGIFLDGITKDLAEDGIVIDHPGNNGIKINHAGSNNTTGIGPGKGNGITITNSRQHGISISTVGLGSTGNSDYDGIRISGSLPSDGIEIITSGNAHPRGIFIHPEVADLDGGPTKGILIREAGNGVEIRKSINNAILIDSTKLDGIVIDHTTGNGLFVTHSTLNGLNITKAGLNGIYIDSTESSGIRILNPNLHGLDIQLPANSPFHGIRSVTYGNGNAGYFWNNDSFSSTLYAENNTRNWAGYFVGHVRITDGLIVDDFIWTKKDLYVNNTAFINDDLFVDSSAFINGNTTVGGDMTVVGALTVYGESTFKDVSVDSLTSEKIIALKSIEVNPGGGTSYNNRKVTIDTSGIVVSKTDQEKFAAAIKMVMDFLPAPSGFPGWNAVKGSMSLVAEGGKSAFVETQSYGRRLFWADESTRVYFFDRGRDTLVAGLVTIPLDSIFLECICDTCSYLVQITPTSDCNGLFVQTKSATSFTVKELMGGTSNATFDWEVQALRKNWEFLRLPELVEQTNK